MNVGPLPKPNLFCMNESHKFHYFGIMKIAFMLIKNQGKQKIILKSKKICDIAYLKANIAS